MELAATTADVLGSAEGGDVPLLLKVEGARPHSLVVRFQEREKVPGDGQRFERVTLVCSGRSATLGPCEFERDPLLNHTPLGVPPLGDGHLVFLEHVYDFSQLFANGRITELSQKVRQLPLLWGRKATIQPAFRDFTSQLLYDFQVYRGLFDTLDRSLSTEPLPVRDSVHRVATQAEYANFKRFFDEQLAALEGAVKDFGRQDHERHGYFFRKQLWDLIQASEFMLRTNLKPRGYAGDSLMMRMVYEREFRGATLFSKFMHRHPLDTRAAEAVRNRRSLLAKAMRAACGRAAPRAKARVLSVACGPLWELRDVLTGKEDFEALELVLLDQDPLALADAKGTITALEAAYGARLQAALVRDSVRTMLRTPNLSSRFGSFDLAYSMGLFDYLTPPVARAVLAKLWEVVAPGGELVVGNYHVKNETRVYMEYWMDWAIYHRTEAELLELAADLPGAEARVTFEETGTQMFLSVKRP